MILHQAEGVEPVPRVHRDDDRVIRAAAVRRAQRHRPHQLERAPLGRCRSPLVESVLSPDLELVRDLRHLHRVKERPVLDALAAQVIVLRQELASVRRYGRAPVPRRVPAQRRGARRVALVLVNHGLGEIEQGVRPADDAHGRGVVPGQVRGLVEHLAKPLVRQPVRRDLGPQHRELLLQVMRRRGRRAEARLSGELRRARGLPFGAGRSHGREGPLRGVSLGIRLRYRARRGASDVLRRSPSKASRVVQCTRCQI